MKHQKNILLQKVKRFINRYYLNQLIKGTIILLASLIILLLILSLTEFYNYFNSTTRLVFLLVYIGIHSVVFFYYILIPIFRLTRIFKGIDAYNAAKIIGRHFKEVDDKLLNTLQLLKTQERTELQEQENELLRAAIDKKTFQLKRFPFYKAVNFSVNKKYLHYLVYPTLILIVILIFIPELVTNPTQRIINYSIIYEKPQPYYILINNSELTTLQGNSFELQVKTKGKISPNKVFISKNGNISPLKKESNNSFRYTFHNPVNNTKFFLFTHDGVETEKYELKVLPKPAILDFTLALDYPQYTGKEDEIIANNGDITVAEGTKVKWKFRTKHTDSIFYYLNDTNIQAFQKQNNNFGFRDQYYESTNYRILYSNSDIYFTDTISYAITVVKDEYPKMSIQQFSDSLIETQKYFTGQISDDYGFSKLLFHYYFAGEDDPHSKNNRDEGKIIEIKKGVKRQEFFHYFDFGSINLDPGERILYYFEVFDNDGVNGPKSTMSQKYTFKKPTLDDIAKKSSTIGDNIENNLKQSKNEINKLQNEIKDFKKRLLENKNLDWKDKEKLEGIIQKQKQLEENLRRTNQLQKEKQVFDENVSEDEERLINKQKELQKLFKDLINEELKKQIEELQDLLDKFQNKDQLNRKMDDLEMSNKEMEKHLDRQLELFKRMQVEQKLQQSIKKLDNLSKEQEKLKIQTEKSLEDQETLQNDQKKINDDFDDFNKGLDELQESNNSLEKPYKLEETQKDSEEIENSLQDALQELEQQKNQNSSQMQQKAIENMNNLSQKLQDMFQSMQMQSMGEDVEKLKQLLDNLVTISFDQEDLIERFKKIDKNNPKYIEYVQEQKNIRDDLKMVEDTLFSISKRQIQIQPIINKEVEKINRNLKYAIRHAEERHTNAVRSRQQFIMTSVNNLALLLAESIDDMQNQMSGMKGSGQSSGSKPSASPMPSLRQMQQQLNQQIQQLKQSLKSGEKNQGETQGKQSMSEQLARMAAEQAAIRRKLQELSGKYESEGSFQLSKMLKEAAKRMEMTEKELVNKVISKQTINRQKQIETRMLESERAEKQQKKEKKRVSEEAKNKNYGNKSEFFEYNSKKKKKGIELLKTVSPELNLYYKTKVKHYFYNLEE